jgi:transposase
MLRLSLEHLAFLEKQIDAIDAEVYRLLEQEDVRQAFERLQSIPGIQQVSAAALLAETGADMKVFGDEKKLSSWLGVSPGNNISAGRNKSGAISRGNRWARTTLVECAWAASRTKGCHLKDRFHKLSVKGKKPALIAVAHALAVLMYRTLSSGQPYKEANAPQPDERTRERLIRHHVRRLGKLGVAVHAPGPAPSRTNNSTVGTRTIHIHHKQ